MLTIQEQVRLGCDAWGYSHTLLDSESNSFNEEARKLVKLYKKALQERQLRGLRHDLNRRDPSIGKVTNVSRKIERVKMSKLLALQAKFAKCY